MQILNGDHAQFEIEHANTPMKERPDWPYQSFDARDWAEAFCKVFPSVDEGTALSWFASALMRGHDEVMERYAKRLRDINNALDIQKSTGNWDYDPYMHGMANGMIFCAAVLDDETPDYLDAPEIWGKDKPQTNEQPTQAG